MKGEYISVSTLVAQSWVNHNQSYKGLPMDDALVIHNTKRGLNGL
jgi:hypothetical protein